MFYDLTYHQVITVCSLRASVHDFSGISAVKMLLITWCMLHFFNVYRHLQYIRLPFVKCAPWGKLSSWLCSASQEYMALASLDIKTRMVSEDADGFNRVDAVMVIRHLLAGTG